MQHTRGDFQHDSQILLSESLTVTLPAHPKMCGIRNTEIKIIMLIKLNVCCHCQSICFKIMFET